jgi:hypothetical protein
LSILKFLAIQTGSRTCPGCYTIGTGGAIPQRWSIWAWSTPLSPIQCWGLECIELYLHALYTTFHGTKQRYKFPSV